MIEMEKPRVECVEKSEDGKYARLFEIQSRYYQEGKEF